MEIVCNSCSQKYRIPDSRVEDKRIYFFCERCSNRIVVDRKRESWFSYRFFEESVLHVQDLFEGIFLSFNWKNILFTFILLIIYSLIMALFSFIGRENMSYFTSYPASFVIFLVLLFLLLLSVFDIHLYMLSRNIFNRIHYGMNIDYSANSHDIYIDSLAVILISAGSLLLFFILLLPVYPMERLGFVYGGFISPVLILLMAGILVVQVFKNIILAYIAHRQRDMKNTLAGIVRFFRVENINIAVYGVIISIITAIIHGFIMIILLSAVLFTAAFITGFAASSYFTGGVETIMRLRELLMGVGTAGADVPFEWSGMVLIGLTFYLFFLFVLSLGINLVQSLSTVAVHIMGTNPGRSINRNALLILFGILSAILLFGTALFL